MGRWAEFWRWRRVRRVGELRAVVMRNRPVVAAFVAGRAAQSDAEFVAACGDNFPAAGLLAARRAVARVAGVRARFVRAEERFGELLALPGWALRGDPRDPIAGAGVLLIAQVECGLGVRFADSELERADGLEPTEAMTVREYAVAVAGLASAVVGVPERGA